MGYQRWKKEKWTSHQHLHCKWKHVIDQIKTHSINKRKVLLIAVERKMIDELAVNEKDFTKKRINCDEKKKKKKIISLFLAQKVIWWRMKDLKVDIPQT